MPQLGAAAFFGRCNMKNKEIFRTLKFVLFSASAGIIQMGSFAIFNELLLWKYWPAYLVSLVLSVLWNFTFNRRFTFKSTANVPRAMVLVALYYCVFTPVTTVLGNFLVEDMVWNEYLVTVLNMALNLVTEFLYQRFVVYRNSVDTNELAK